MHLVRAHPQLIHVGQSEPLLHFILVSDFYYHLEKKEM